MPSFTIFSVLGLVSHNRALRSRGCSGYYQFHCYGILWHAGNLIYSTVFKQFQMSNCDIAISKNSYINKKLILSHFHFMYYMDNILCSIVLNSSAKLFGMPHKDNWSDTNKKC